jgi:hypothetical protein
MREELIVFDIRLPQRPEIRPVNRHCVSVVTCGPAMTQGFCPSGTLCHRRSQILMKESS